MPTHRDRLPQELAEALNGVADDAAVRIVAEARRNAYDRVRDIVEEALVEQLLAHCSQLIRADGPGNRSGHQPRADHSEREAADPVAVRRSSDGDALYVYGVVASDGPNGPLTTSLQSNAPTELISHAGLAAATKRVPLSEFGDEPLKLNLERMDWLERTARDHESVLQKIRAQTTVIPMRMCTVFRDAESVREMLTHEGVALKQALARLAAHDEWGVKALADVPAVQRALTQQDTAVLAAAPPGSGRAYLEGKQSERRRVIEAGDWVRSAVSEVHDRLAAAATTSVRNATQPPELSGYQDEMVLNGAYLVPEHKARAFSALVADLNEQYAPGGLRLELTGPWPPYNFVPPPAPT